MGCSLYSSFIRLFWFFMLCHLICLGLYVLCFFVFSPKSIYFSENFNLSTALRQAMFQSTATSWVGTFPAALMGVSWDLWQFHRSINVVMQFWIHSQYVQNLGPIEYIFNTPTQHIIHHSRAPGHCNKVYM